MLRSRYRCNTSRDNEHISCRPGLRQRSRVRNETAYVQMTYLTAGEWEAVSAADIAVSMRLCCHCFNSCDFAVSLQTISMPNQAQSCQINTSMDQLQRCTTVALGFAADGKEHEVTRAHLRPNSPSRPDTYATVLETTGSASGAIYRHFGGIKQPILVTCFPTALP